MADLDLEVELSDEKIIYVKFLKPTINFAAGDIEAFPESYVKQVLIPYVKKYFESDQRDRFKVVGAPEAVEIKDDEPSEDALNAEAIALGIDPAEYKTTAGLKKAIAKAKQ
jgi:hypothetical protein